MALTGRVIFSNYDGSNTNGRATSLPSNLTKFSALPTSKSLGGITVITLVELLPSGLVQGTKQFFSVDTPATLATNGT